MFICVSTYQCCGPSECISDVDHRIRIQFLNCPIPVHLITFLGVLFGKILSSIRIRVLSKNFV